MTTGTLATPVNSLTECQTAGANSSIPQMPTFVGHDYTGVETTTTAGDTSEQIIIQPAAFPSGVNTPIVVPGPIHSAPSYSMPWLNAGTGKSKEDLIQERLAEFDPEKIHEFIRNNRKTITNLEEIIISLLKNADLMAYEILKPLMVAKAEAFKMIEYALHTLEQRCTPIDNLHPGTVQEFQVELSNEDCARIRETITARSKAVSVSCANHTCIQAHVISGD